MLQVGSTNQEGGLPPPPSGAVFWVGPGGLGSQKLGLVPPPWSSPPPPPKNIGTGVVLVPWNASLLKAVFFSQTLT